MRIVRRRGEAPGGAGADVLVRDADVDPPDLVLLQLLPRSGSLEPRLRDEVPTLAGEWRLGASTVLLTTTGVVHVLGMLAREAWTMHLQGTPAERVGHELAARFGLDGAETRDRVVPLLAQLPQVRASEESVPRSATASSPP